MDELVCVCYLCDSECYVDLNHKQKKNTQKGRQNHSSSAVSHSVARFSSFSSLSKPSELKPIRVKKASFNNPAYIGIFNSRRYPLLVVNLLIDLLLINMRAIGHDHLDLILGWEELVKLYLDHEPNHLRHGAMRDGGREVHLDLLAFLNEAALVVDHVQLL